MSSGKDHNGVIVSSCPECGKVGYSSRAAAKKAARVRHPDDHLSAYKCGSLWHIGHLPHSVQRGIADRSTLRPGGKWKT